MARKEMDLSSLSLDQLIWSMMSVLNYMHDMGGVSCSRSARSMCLEVALSYGRHYRVLEDVEIGPVFRCETWTLVGEARKRSASSQLVLFEELALCHATDRQLAEIAMYEMGQWYENDHARHDAINFVEYELAMEIVRLMTPRFKPIYHDELTKFLELHLEWSDREYEWSDIALDSRYQALREI